MVMEERKGGGEGVRVTCDHPRRYRQAPGVTLGSSAAGWAAGGAEEGSAAGLAKRPSFFTVGRDIQGQRAMKTQYRASSKVGKRP